MRRITKQCVVYVDNALVSPFMLYSIVLTGSRKGGYRQRHVLPCNYHLVLESRNFFFYRFTLGGKAIAAVPKTQRVARSERRIV